MASVSKHPERKGMTYKTVIHALLTKTPRPPIDQIIKALKEDFPKRANRDHKKDIGKVLKKLFRGRLKLEQFTVSIAAIPEEPIDIKGIGKFEAKKPKEKKVKAPKGKKEDKEPEEVDEEPKDSKVKDDAPAPKSKSKAKTEKIEKKGKAKKEEAEEEPEDA